MIEIRPPWTAEAPSEMTALPSPIPDKHAAGSPDASTGAPGRQLDEAAALHRAGKLDEAEAAYRAILAKAPDHPDTLHLLGYLHHQMDRDGAAVTCFTRSIAADGEKPMVHANLGNVLLRQGDMDGAVGCFRAALSLDPGNRLFLSRLAEGFARGWVRPIGYSAPDRAGRVSRRRCDRSPPLASNRARGT